MELALAVSGSPEFIHRAVEVESGKTSERWTQSRIWTGIPDLKIAGSGVTGRLKPDKSDSRLTAIRLLLMLNAVRRVFPVAGRS